MKLLITCLFLGLSFVMMSSSFAQSDDLLVAIEKQTKSIKKQTKSIKEQTEAIKKQTKSIKEQTEAIKKQTKSIKEQTRAMKDIAILYSSFSYNPVYTNIRYQDINFTTDYIKRRENDK